MVQVTMPQAPPSGGEAMDIAIDMNQEELNRAVVLLKQIAAKLAEKKAASVAGSSTVPSTSQHATASAAALPIPKPAAVSCPQQLPVPAAVPSLPVPTASKANTGSPSTAQPPIPKVVPPPQHTSPQAKPAKAAAEPLAKPQQRTPPPPVPVQVPVPVPVPVPAPQPQALPAQLARLPAWKQVFSSDPGDHNGDSVSSIRYCPKFDGLPGGDGHAGWLISSSRHLMNLWECSGGGGKGQPSLMVMHAQMTDFVSTSLALEPSLQLLFAASTDTRLSTECISVHSLSPELGFLSSKYRMVLPVLPASPAGQQQRRALTTVASLHHLGRHMQGWCAVSQAGKIMLYEAHPGSDTANVQRPALEWAAHQSPVTALHTSPHMGMLYSGAADGSITMWTFQGRQPRSLQTFRAPTGSAQPPRPTVTSLQLVHEQSLLSSFADGRVMIWDTRNTAQPRAVVTPDGTACLKMKTSPIGDCVAVATVRGIYAIDLLDGTNAVSSIAELQQGKPALDLEWNSSTLELYACFTSGAINVYSQIS